MGHWLASTDEVKIRLGRCSAADVRSVPNGTSMRCELAFALGLANIISWY
jgi:hypothetical protein